ncbi:MAG: hypothetical protein ACJ72C_04895, partial [Nitrososphaeraceae archaeon]
MVQRSILSCSKDNIRSNNYFAEKLITPSIIITILQIYRCTMAKIEDGKTKNNWIPEAFQKSAQT